MFVVNKGGQLNIVISGLATILTGSNVYNEITSTGVLVHVLEGEVTVQTLAGGSLQLSENQAGAVDARGVIRSIGPGEDDRIRSRVRVAQQLMGGGWARTGPSLPLPAVQRRGSAFRPRTRRQR